MKFHKRIPVLAVATLALLAATTGCNRLKARDQLVKGIQSYKSAQYEEAIDHFQNAVHLDPTLPMARAYLATAYMQQVVPNLDTPENLKNAQNAIDSFQGVLKEDPTDVNAVKGIASIYFNIKKFNEAKEYQKKVLAMSPNDAQAAYTIGVIDWTEAYQHARDILAPEGLTDNGEGNAKMSKTACKAMQAANTDLVAEGLQYLLKAVAINPNYDDAMAYLNLTYRRKADMECGDEAARAADVAEAVKWFDKAMGTRKMNEEKKNKPGAAKTDGQSS
ncbi:MAG: tetratricopeptide repeat protein [Acidobacteriaceae bacterium]